jgi:hypothetical protein
MNATVRVGVIGLSITLAINLFGLLVLRQAAAQFFTGDWWSVWFPSFIVWLVMTIIGLGRQRYGKRHGGNPQRS